MECRLANEAENHDEGPEGHQWHGVPDSLCLVVGLVKRNDAVTLELPGVALADHPRSHKGSCSSRHVHDARASIVVETAAVEESRWLCVSERVLVAYE